MLKFQRYTCNMAAPAIDRRGLVVAQGVLVTVHDLYGGAWPLRPLEVYLRHGRGFDVEPFRYRPRSQVRPSTDVSRPQTVSPNSSAASMRL